tara:strand:- start:71 stop:319 length:249 start_codon:yes stop_codon:yes gene_type:complete
MDSERVIELIKAKVLLESDGYHIGNLWRTEDVCNRYDCTDKQAKNLLLKVLDSQYITEIIFEMITEEAHEMNFKPLEEDDDK